MTDDTGANGQAGSAAGGADGRLPEDESPISEGSPVPIEDAINRWLDKGGLTELPASYHGRPQEYWKSVNSTDPFRVLLLDRTRPEVSQDVVDRQFQLLKRSWQDLLARLDTGGGVRDAILQKYQAANRQGIAAHVKHVEAAYSRLLTAALRDSENKAWQERERAAVRARVLEVLKPLLVDGELKGVELVHLFGACQFPKEQVASIVLDQLAQEGFQPVGNTDRDAISAAARLRGGAPWIKRNQTTPPPKPSPQTTVGTSRPVAAGLRGPNRTLASALLALLVMIVVTIAVAAIFGAGIFSSVLNQATASRGNASSVGPSSRADPGNTSTANPGPGQGTATSSGAATGPDATAPPTGALRIVSHPGGSTIRMDGAYLGTTDESGGFSMGLPPGNHEITVQHDGFGEAQRSVFLVAGQALDLAVNLQPLPAVEIAPTALVLQSPSDAYVLLDGAEVPAGESRVPVSVGQHSITATEPGHLPFHWKVNAVEGQTQTVDVVLSPIPTGGAPTKDGTVAASAGASAAVGEHKASDSAVGAISGGLQSSSAPQTQLNDGSFGSNFGTGRAVGASGNVSTGPANAWSGGPTHAWAASVPAEPMRDFDAALAGGDAVNGVNQLAGSVMGGTQLQIALAHDHYSFMGTTDTITRVELVITTDQLIMLSPAATQDSFAIDWQDLKDVKLTRFVRSAGPYAIIALHLEINAIDGSGRRDSRTLNLFTPTARIDSVQGKAGVACEDCTQRVPLLVLLLQTVRGRALAIPHGGNAHFDGHYAGLIHDSTGPGDMTWDLTQTGSSVSGAVHARSTGGATFSGTIAGSVSGRTLSFTMTISQVVGPLPPSCSITITGAAERATGNAFMAHYSGKSGCTKPFNDGLATLTRQAAGHQ